MESKREGWIYNTLDVAGSRTAAQATLADKMSPPKALSLIILAISFGSLLSAAAPFGRVYIPLVSGFVWILIAPSMLAEKTEG